MIHYKTLKHKTLPGIYAYFANSPVEICHVSIPRLMSMSVSIKSLQDYYYDQPLVLEQLNDYELITVSIIPGLTGIDVAAGLFNIHHHSPEDELGNPAIMDSIGNGCIIYKESELLPLLKSWGLPEPDWEGNAKRDELELLSCPGDTIKETMEALGIDMPLFVIKMGISSQGAHDLLKGKAPITEAIARRLELTLNVDAQFWLSREQNYREKLAKLQNTKP